MKNLEDEAVERVLSGLRMAEPHAGLEERVQLRLVQAGVGSAARPRVARWGRRSVGFSAVAVATLLICFSLLHQGGQSGRAAPPQKADSTTHSQSEAAATRSPAAVIARLPGPQQTRRSFPARRVELPRPPALVAASYVRSFPAPPEPLTRQEKLLVRVVQHPDPVVVAQLNPEAREQVAKLDAKAFQQFFRPSALEEKINALQAAQLPPQK